MALPISAAPLAATLNSGAIAGIALGAAAFVVAGVAGGYIYRHYHRRSAPVDADDLLELVTINNTAVQEVVDKPMIKAFRGEARGEPAGEQRSRRPPPEPLGLKKPLLPEKPPIRTRDPFYGEFREQVIPWHEHKNEDVGEYEDVDTCNPRRMSTAI
ncbi:hypothetical protein [Salinisphaera sp. G21_0]|uniref:hypothetical protein n=1 Tax=Salinisphaera sp. G21_0 TaxID=2821094 RepID=UPI001AD9B9BD|nr:hypothetical protein [Salinisphaera sp. G21_0]MBO9481496.1 hypothetical protein [Salinisphaera sp. G21_0]